MYPIKDWHNKDNTVMPWYRLIFVLGIHILVLLHLYIETTPVSNVYKCLSNIPINYRRQYICNVFSHCLNPCLMSSWRDRENTIKQHSWTFWQQMACGTMFIRPSSTTNETNGDHSYDPYKLTKKVNVIITSNVVSEIEKLNINHQWLWIVY